MNLLLDWLEQTVAEGWLCVELWWLRLDSRTSRKLYERTLSPAHHEQYKHDKSATIAAEQRLQDLQLNRRDI